MSVVSRRALAIAVVVAASAMLLVPGCKKATQPTEPESELVLSENTWLPEENADLEKVLIEGDTLLFIYRPGVPKPAFSVGDIVVGETEEGYLRRVLSSVAEGDTLILLTEQASLTDAIVKGNVDTTFALSPTQQQLNPIRDRSIFKGDDGREYRLDIRSDGPSVYPSAVGPSFDIKIPNVVIEVWDPDNNLAVVLSIDTIVVTKSVDFDFSLEIESGELKEFRLLGISTDEVSFVGLNMDLRAAVSAVFERSLLPPIPLGKIVIWIGYFPIVISFDLQVYGGMKAELDLDAGIEVANDVTVICTNTVGAQYRYGSWEPIWDNSLNCNGDFTFTPVSTLSASLTNYLKGGLNTRLYGGPGPQLYLKPYQYNEIGFPPLDYELGVGIAAGLAFKVKILDWMLVDFDYTFLDYRKVLVHSTEGPDAPALDAPTDGSTVADNTPTFEWGEPAGVAGYQIHVDDDRGFSLPEINSYPVASTYTPSIPLFEGSYYWRVRAKDASDAWGAWSDVWRVSIDTGGGNNPPNIPSIPTGPSSGDPDVSYGFSSSTSDPDGDDIAIRFAWSDGDTSDWSSGVPSGSKVYMSHSWASNGIYHVKAQAKDNLNALSGWSMGHTIRIGGGEHFPNRVVDVVAVGTRPEASVVLPNGNYIYVAHDIGVSVIQASDNSVVEAISIPGSPVGLAALPSGEYVYATGRYADVVSVIRTSDNQVVDEVAVGDYPVGVAVLPNGDYVYVSNATDNTVSVIRTSDNTVVHTITVGATPRRIAILPDGSLIYVVAGGSNTVSVIRTSDNTAVDEINVGLNPRGIAVLPDGSRVYVANGASGNVSVIRSSDRMIVDVITVGSATRGIVPLPTGDYIYVVNQDDNNISVIRTSDNAIVDVISVGNTPNEGIAVLPNGERVYVTNYHSGSVSVIGF